MPPGFPEDILRVFNDVYFIPLCKANKGDFTLCVCKTEFKEKLSNSYNVHYTFGTLWICD